MPYDREHFFTTVRKDLFGGTMTQSQVDSCNYMLAVWEDHFEKPNPRDGTNWLSYCFATVFHETGQKMRPVEEVGKGSGKSYGKPVGPYGKAYYGRGHPQLTWEDNYKKGKDRLKAGYNIVADLHQFPEKMLEDEVSVLVLYDGMTVGWFTGVGLPKYFNGTTEDAYNARRVVNVLDKAEAIRGYYNKFKKSLKKTDATAPPPEVSEDEPIQHPEDEGAPMEKPEQVVRLTLASDTPLRLNVMAGENVEIV